MLILQVTEHFHFAVSCYTNELRILFDLGYSIKGNYYSMSTYYMLVAVHLCAYLIQQSTYNI